jgi:hypothetical protein
VWSYSEYAAGVPNHSLKLTALSRGLHLGGWGEAEAVKGTSQAKPRGSLVRPVMPPQKNREKA